MYSDIFVAVGTICAIPLFVLTILPSAKPFANSWHQELLVALGAGCMLANAILHLIPEAIYHNANAPYQVLGGIIGFWILEKIVHWHHHAGDKGANETAVMITVADSIHNFVDGVLIAAVYLTNQKLGLATTIAVAAHEIPQEIGEFATLRASGWSRAKALTINLASACTALLGAGCMIFFAEKAESAAELVLPIAAGGFVYVALSDVIPLLRQRAASHKAQHKAHGAQVVGLILGVALIASATKLIGEHQHASPTPKCAHKH